MWQTNLWGAFCETEAIVYVCVHDDASSWLMFVGSRGQCPSFCSSIRILSFSLWQYLPFCSSCSPVVHRFFSQLRGWLQSSWRLLLVSAHNSSLSQFMPCQCFTCSVLSVIAFLVAVHNLRTKVRLTTSHSVYFFSSLYNSRSKFSKITQHSLCVYGPWETHTAALCRAQRNKAWEFRASHAVFLKGYEQTELRRTWYSCRLEQQTGRWHERLLFNGGGGGGEGEQSERIL